MVVIKVIIDRFEGQYVVCEKDDMTMVNIKLNLVPGEAKEGDVLIIDGETICIDVDETKERKIEIEKLAEDLWE